MNSANLETFLSGLVKERNAHLREIVKLDAVISSVRQRSKSQDTLRNSIRSVLAHQNAPLKAQDVAKELLVTGYRPNKPKNFLSAVSATMSVMGSKYKEVRRVPGEGWTVAYSVVPFAQAS